MAKPRQFTIDQIPGEVWEGMAIEYIGQNSFIGMDMLNRYEEIKKKYPEWFPDSPAEASTPAKDTPTPPPGTPPGS